MFRTLRFYHSFFKFLSTPSARRATQDQIHHLWRGGHFYPRPPRGGRPQHTPITKPCSSFLSTPSARRATLVHLFQAASGFDFYPRPPRGGRRHRLTGLRSIRHFYPRPPRGGRPPVHSAVIAHDAISIHALREEGDGYLGRCISTHRYFYPRPPRGGRLSRSGGFVPNAYISIHALREEGDQASYTVILG